MKLLITLYWLLFFSVFCVVTISAQKVEKIAVISDTHFLSSKLAAKDNALSVFELATGRNVADLHEVLDKVLTDLTAENIDVLLISGDITNHGERESHIDFIEKLKPLQQNGTRIFVVPGNHDVNIPDARAYIGNAPTATQSISATQFAQLYASFGYADALKKDSASLSYLATLNDSVWLLCIDTNRHPEHKTSSISSGRILPQTLTWALEILTEAKTQNKMVLGMMHHGLVEHAPYQASFFPNYLIDDWAKNAEILADAGLKVVFTGHFHSNDVSLFTSAAGNILYDVETASLAQYPFAYRIIELKNNRLFIDTRFVTSVPGNPNLEDRYRRKLETITRSVAKNRLNSLGMPLPSQTSDALTELLVTLNLMHVRGDEKPDEEMKNAIRNFAKLLGSDDVDMDEFALDFPPTDNVLVIELGSRSLDVQ